MPRRISSNESSPFDIVAPAGAGFTNELGKYGGLMSDPLAEAFANHLAEIRAIDAAWRRLCRDRRPRISLSEFIDDVMAKCPWATRAEVRCELERRIKDYRPRRGPITSGGVQ
jgi:hypothetical protein